MQISPNRLAELSLESFEGAVVRVKPATGPQRTTYIGAMGRDGANIGELAVQICRKHVVEAEGLPSDFDRRDPQAFDLWEPEWMFEVMTFVVGGSRMTAADAKN